MTNDQYTFIISVSSIINRYFPCLRHLGDWIGCQFALESNFGSSKLALDCCNFCGMRNPMVRISTSFSRGLSTIHWAHYYDLDSCVIDYVLCVQYHKPIDFDIIDPSHYSMFISKFYCPDKGYIDKINKIYSQFKSYQNGKEK